MSPHFCTGLNSHEQRTTRNQSHLRTRRHRPRPRHLARLRRLQTHRRHHLHRLQGLRSRVPGMERLSVPRNRFRQHLPDHAGSGVELLQPDPLQRTRRRRRHLQLADAQGRLHALRRSRLPARVPGRRRHRAIRQRHRRFQSGQLHRLPVLRDRLPVQYSRSSITRPRRSTSARCARIAWARAWSRPASKPVPPAACTSAARTT